MIKTWKLWLLGAMFVLLTGRNLQLSFENLALEAENDYLRYVLGWEDRP